jgi:threonine dehydratase
MAGEVPGHGSVCAVLSGGNVDPVLLMKIIDHGLTASGRYVVIRVVIADTPGQLADITRIVADMGINVLQVEHHRSGRNIEADQVEIDMTLECRSITQQAELLAALDTRGIMCTVED